MKFSFGLISAVVVVLLLRKSHFEIFGCVCVITTGQAARKQVRKRFFIVYCQMGYF